MIDDILFFDKNPIKKVKTEPVEQNKSAPWMSKTTRKIRQPLAQMHNEIIEFYNYVTPSKKEHEDREKVFQRIKKFVEDNCPGCQLQPFGSYVTKLYLPNSDIDCVMVNENESIKKLQDQLESLIKRNQEMFQSIEVIRNAKVPLIKLIDNQSQIMFDFSFNTMDGIVEMNKAFEIYPEIKYLVMVIKCVLKQRRLNDTYRGGVGSFLLFCMILAFLRELRRQFIEKNKLKELQNLMLSEILLKFLEFYGVKFELGRTQITMVGGGDILDKRIDDMRFSLISPQDNAHDIGNNSILGVAAFNIRDVFSVFKNRFNFMTNYNFAEDESVFQYIVNPTKQTFSYYQEE